MPAFRPQDLLARVHWQEAGSQAEQLAAAGFSHGFEGVNGVPPTDVWQVTQVHGTEIQVAPYAGEQGHADGLVTWTPGTCVAVKTADCLPILIGAPGRAAMALHAGWRGLTAGIVAAGLRALAGQALSPRDLTVAIGPAIGLAKFEVGPEVVEAILGPRLALAPEAAALTLAKGRGDRWHVDLALAAVLTLIAGGVPADHITVIQACTASDSRWHSFRRQGRSMGNNWSWLRLGAAPGR